MTADPLLRILALRELEVRRVVGLMSGTSADGIDAALVEIRGAGEAVDARLVSFTTVALEDAVKRRIWNLPDDQAVSICELNFLLGEAFARAAIQVTRSAGLSLDQVHLIGSHGQTARHQPPGSDATIPSTLQLGEGAVIAERTGCPVICDFRVADVAAGGHGAPLIPLVDYLLFRSDAECRVMLNLGGIANLTLLPSSRGEVTAFDTGPANMALDAVARAATGGACSFDTEGQIAAQGTVAQDLLGELLGHPYFCLPPPKSTGREMFGRAFVYPLIDRYRDRLPDLMATLSQLTAESVAQAVVQHLSPRARPDRVIVSGGGVHNQDLMGRLAARLSPLPVTTLQDLGLDPDAKEALGFAVLANESLFGHPGNLPRATGAAGPRILGKLVLPPPCASPAAEG